MSDATTAVPEIVEGTLDPVALAKATRRAVTRALAEDLGDRGDVTARATVPPTMAGEAEIVAREPGVISGLAAVVEAFAAVDPRIDVEVQVADGDRVITDQVIAVVKGPMRAILTAERTALNFLGHLSGIATQTAKLQDLIEGTGCHVRDTRKTTPGLRLLEKAAVVDGGGANHRIGLYDAILVKENHILAAGGVTQAIENLRRANPGVAVQVEVERAEQIWTLIDMGVTDILLDNFTVEEVELASQRVAGRARLEVSGNIDASTIRAYAEAIGAGGRLAVGAITHSAPNLDVALDVVERLDALSPETVAEQAAAPQVVGPIGDDPEDVATTPPPPDAQPYTPPSFPTAETPPDAPEHAGPSRPAEEFDQGAAQGAPFSWRQSPFRSRRPRGD